MQQKSSLILADSALNIFSTRLSIDLWIFEPTFCFASAFETFHLALIPDPLQMIFRGSHARDHFRFSFVYRWRICIRFDYPSLLTTWNCWLKIYQQKTRSMFQSLNVSIFIAYWKNTGDLCRVKRDNTRAHHIQHTRNNTIRTQVKTQYYIHTHTWDRKLSPILIKRRWHAPARADTETNRHVLSELWHEFAISVKKNDESTPEFCLTHNLHFPDQKIIPFVCHRQKRQLWPCIWYRVFRQTISVFRQECRDCLIDATAFIDDPVGPSLSTCLFIKIDKRDQRLWQTMLI